jgi:hypothetical protein
MRGKHVLAVATILVGLAVIGLAAHGQTPTAANAQVVVLCVERSSPSTQQEPNCIEIIKQTDPDGADQAFEFYLDAPIVIGADFDLSDDESISLGVVVNGTYIITEEVPDGWRLVDIECEDVSEFDVDINVREGWVRLTTSSVEDGPQAVCTFFNQREDLADDEDEDDEAGARFLGGGLFAGDVGAAQRNRARAAASAAVAAAPRAAEATVRPPSTGDGGLR